MLGHRVGDAPVQLDDDPVLARVDVRPQQHVSLGHEAADVLDPRFFDRLVVWRRRRRLRRRRLRWIDLGNGVPSVAEGICRCGRRFVALW